MATKKNTSINGKEYYRITRTIDGTKKQFYGSSKGDAERQYREYIEELAKKKQDQAYDVSKFSARAHQYIDDVLMVSQRYAEGTKARYESAYRIHIEGTPLDRMILGEIKPAHIQKFYNQLEVSAPTLKNIHKFMVSFNKWLMRNNFAGDFLSAVEIPKKEENKRHDGIITWDEEEVETILASLRRTDSFRLSFLIYVLLYTGARISEALSLRYSDIEDGVVHIRRQHYMGEIKPPKYNSVRDIPAHEELLFALIDHKAWHEEEMRKNKYKTEYIFTTSSGNLYSASSVRKALVRFCERIGVPYKHIHAYRATFCTQMCRCGVPLEVTSALMGHKNLEVTAAHYALVKRDTKELAISALKY